MIVLLWTGEKSKVQYRDKDYTELRERQFVLALKVEEAAMIQRLCIWRREGNISFKNPRGAWPC